MNLILQSDTIMTDQDCLYRELNGCNPYIHPWLPVPRWNKWKEMYIVRLDELKSLNIDPFNIVCYAPFFLAFVMCCLEFMSFESVMISEKRLSPFVLFHIIMCFIWWLLCFGCFILLLFIMAIVTIIPVLFLYFIRLFKREFME